METAKRIVEEGYGVTIIPAIAARREIETGLLRRLDVERFDLSVDYGLFYPKGRLFSRPAEAFLRALHNLTLFPRREPPSHSG